MTERPRLVTPRFALVVVAGIFYFLSIGVVIPEIPRFVKHELDGGSLAVGVTVGALFVGAVLLRPLAGRIGDRYGRKLLIVTGAATVGVSMIGYALADSLLTLIAARVVTGLGEAAFFVGAATMITDLAPVERRGEAISYWSVAVYSGFAFGPAIGETVQREWGYTTLWLLAAAFGFASAALGCFTREVARVRHDGPPQPLINRRALAPGTVLFAGLVATAAFGAFMPLYGPDVGIDDVAIVFTVFGLLVLAIRVFGARLPDILGGARAGTVALVATGVGMLCMAAWPSVAGLFVGVVIFAVGSAFLYPAMMLMALEGSTEQDRGSAVGTISSCFDLSQGLGSLLVGVVAALTSYRGAFAASSVATVFGVVVLWQWVVPRLHRARIADAAQAP
ncbi:MAG: MFS transporter [Actinobacteria bacterium]|nr:MFS transporter [Actinomycetota bacterium]